MISNLGANLQQGCLFVFPDIVRMDGDICMQRQIFRYRNTNVNYYVYNHGS